MDPSSPVQLVNNANTGTQAQVARVIWFSPGTWDKGPGRPGQLVDSAGSGTRLRVVWEGWSTPQAEGPGCESSGTAG